MKKFISIILIVVVILSLGYVAVHAYGNQQIVKKYAQGYEKDKLGDLAKNNSGYTFAVHKVPLFSLTDNLSVAKEDGNVDVIIWIDLFGNVSKIGASIAKPKKTYQIYLDKDFTAQNPEDEKIINSVWPELKKMKKVIRKEWDLDLK